MFKKWTASWIILLFWGTLFAQDTYWKDQRIMQLEEITPQLVEAVQWLLCGNYREDCLQNLRWK